MYFDEIFQQLSKTLIVAYRELHGNVVQVIDSKQPEHQIKDGRLSMFCTSQETSIEMNGNGLRTAGITVLFITFLSKMVEIT